MASIVEQLTLKGQQNRRRKIALSPWYVLPGALRAFFATSWIAGPVLTGAAGAVAGQPAGTTLTSSRPSLANW